jgi:hypothetical protein
MRSSELKVATLSGAIKIAAIASITMKKTIQSIAMMRAMFLSLYGCEMYMSISTYIF